MTSTFISFAIGEFAGPGPLRDKLVQAIIDGDKTATSSLHAQYQDADGNLIEDLPVVGAGEVVVDSDGLPVAVIRTTRVELTPLSDITDDFAHAEGEGFANVDEWRDAHLEFWNSIGLHPADDDLVVCQHFELVAKL